MAYSILLVDDEPNIIDGYKRQLGSYFDVQTAVNGYEGLKMLNNYGPFAAVLVDYMMPGMNGIDFTVNARQASPETIRLMLTGKGDLQVATDALNKGSIFMFLSKPCPTDQLIKAVILAVEKYRGCGYISDTVLPEQLEGLKYLYQGLLHWSREKYKIAISTLQAARQEFINGCDNINLARVNLLIIGITLLAESFKIGDDHKLSFRDLAKEALEIYREHGFPVLLRNEVDLLLPALKWAYENNIDKDFLQTILTDIGEPTSNKGLLAIRALGPLQVYSNNSIIEESDWRTPKVKMLFLYLLTNRHKKVNRDTIIEQFWPFIRPQAAGNNLSSAIYSLRQVVGTEKVLNMKGLCWLDNQKYRCDADEFEETIQTATKHLLDGQKEESIRLFKKAVSLYRGDYLEEYIYEEWIENERERLRSIFTKAVNNLADLLANEGRFSEAAETLEKMPRSEVLDDHFLYKLVEYYILSNSRSKAIRRYQHYRSIIVSELGIEPDPVIETLFERKAGP